MNWLKNFDERQQKEIKFSRLYAERFNHGTDGHNAKNIIAGMAIILDEVEKTLEDWSNIEEKDYDISNDAGVLIDICNVISGTK